MVVYYFLRGEYNFFKFIRRWFLLCTVDWFRINLPSNLYFYTVYSNISIGLTLAPREV
jgi:hypothetical protein